MGRSGLEQGAQRTAARHARGRRWRQCGRQATRSPLLETADGARGRSDDHHPSGSAGNGTGRARAVHRRRHSCHRSEVAGDVWALVIGPALQPECDDAWHHPVGPAAGSAERGRDGSTGRRWPPTRPARPSSLSRCSRRSRPGSRRRPRACPASAPGPTAGFTFHNYLDHTLRRQRLARGGDGLQLQHDLHAALDPRLGGEPDRAHRPGRASSASAPRPGSTTWPMTRASCPTQRISPRPRGAAATSPVRAVRPDPAGHRPGQLPRHPAAAGQRLRRVREWRHAVGAADRDVRRPCRRPASSSATSQHAVRHVNVKPGELRLPGQTPPRRRDPSVSAPPTRAFAGFGDPRGRQERNGRDRHTRRRMPGSRPMRRSEHDAEIAVATVLVHVRLATGGPTPPRSCGG